ncbi:MAG: Holliday junction resolvase RuvX [Lachnospiraceae bacterium]|nr:Holliday junction resolvase RuvX [Lachnospiraceae bacterium]
MRVIGLDYGSKTVGVAVSDPMGMGATAVEIIRREKENHLRRTIARIEELTVQYEVEAIVLGLPVNMDGSFGERAEKTLAFKEMLEKRLPLPVFLCDERLTTVEAEEIMAFNGIREKDYKKFVDMIAAKVILEDWMNHQKNAES